MILSEYVVVKPAPFLALLDVTIVAAAETLAPPSRSLRESLFNISPDGRQHLDPQEMIRKIPMIIEVEAAHADVLFLQAFLKGWKLG